MKTVTLTAYERPQYLTTVVSDLSKNNCDGFQLYCALEPGSEACMDICHGIDFMERHIHQNANKLGVSKNPYTVLGRAFAAGSDVNVYLEEDITISADVLDLASWYLENGDPKKELCLLLHAKSTDESIDPEVIHRTDDAFSALGLVILKDQWHEYFKPNWNNHTSGWDYGVHGELRDREDLVTLLPDLSRATHVGIEGGTFYKHSLHGREFEGLVMYSGPPRPNMDYRLED
jgi:hypothetical protein